MKFLPFWEHLEELRKTLLRMGLCVIIGFCIAFFFHQKCLHFLLAPLNQSDISCITYEKKVLVSKKNKYFSVPIGTRVITPSFEIEEGKLQLLAGLPVEIEVPHKGMYFFGPIEGFMLSMKLSFWISVLFTSPFWLYFLCQFLFPAFSKKQRRLFIPFFLLSFCFIACGMALAYKVTLPFVGDFFRSFNEKIGDNFWSAVKTAELALSLVLGHGLIFELYVALLFLIHFRLLAYERLKKARRYVIVLALIIGAILTPPDVLSQLLLAVPMIGLFESSILYAYLRRNKQPLEKHIEFS